MKYLLMIYGNETTWNALSQEDDLMSRHGALLDELSASGELIGTEGLTTAGARTVRVSGGDHVTVELGPLDRLQVRHL